MPPTLELPAITDQTAFNLARWKELSADPSVAALSARVRTDRYGHLIMMPVPGFDHAGFQSDVVGELRNLMRNGKALGECSVSTSEGIRGPDAAWISDARRRRAVKDNLLIIAPEICVEVLSSSNTREEIEEKKELYFEAGADEVWLCDKKGRMFFFLKDAPEDQAVKSKLCPSFPERLSLS